MIGRAQLLDVDVPLPLGVTVRQVRVEDDVRAMAAMQDTVFDGAIADETAQALLRRLALDDGMELWVAEAEGQVVGAGGSTPSQAQTSPGSGVGPLWKRGDAEVFTGRLPLPGPGQPSQPGKTLIHSDSTEYSRPILERSGFVKVSTTTPYLWHQSAAN